MGGRERIDNTGDPEDPAKSLQHTLSFDAPKLLHGRLKT